MLPTNISTCRFKSLLTAFSFVLLFALLSYAIPSLIVYLNACRNIYVSLFSFFLPASNASLTEFDLMFCHTNLMTEIRFSCTGDLCLQPGTLSTSSRYGSLFAFGDLVMSDTPCLNNTGHRQSQSLTFPSFFFFHYLRFDSFRQE